VPGILTVDEPAALLVTGTVSMPARFIASIDTATTTSGSGTRAGLPPLALDRGVSAIGGAVTGLAVSCTRRPGLENFCINR
jgi:hypothetical protein